MKTTAFAPINLISDTVTRPTPGMLAAMQAAAVGDDVFGEDPSVNALQEQAAALFGMEAALFCPSGTMTNQIAIKVHTRPLDEVICDELAHIYNYEVGGYSFHSGVAIHLLQSEQGILQAAQIAAAIKPPYDWLPRSTLVVLENTVNKGGGAYYTAAQIAPISALCQERGLALHLDGARLFNALVATGDTPQHYGNLFDSISICLSKGLGAPVGSLLLGNRDFIKEARRVRKVMGGGMRQAGYLAAAGSYALAHHISRLADDHLHARMIADTLSQCAFVEDCLPVCTNIIIFNIKKPYTAQHVITALAKEHIQVSAFGVATIRMVTHLDVSPAMVARVQAVLSALILPEILEAV